jgi:hypothetical protein
MYDRAIDTVLRFGKAKKDGVMPPMGNLTPNAFVDMVGELKELGKECETLIELFNGIIDTKVQLPTVVGVKHDVAGERFVLTLEPREATRLNQGAAKEKLASLGILPQYMVTGTSMFHTYSGK